MVLFDEFEKVYHETEQKEKMLTLLDGVYPSKKLFVLTCNDQWKLDSNMRNRPGRIYYSIDFHGLDDDFIHEYCQDNLIMKEHISKVCAVAKVFASFNFDMLQAMVEEMNRYSETPTEVLEYLNAQPQFDNESRYMVKLYNKKGKMLNVKSCGTDEWHGNPLKEEIHVHYNDYDKNERFNVDDLCKVEETTGAYIFVNKKGYKLVLKRSPQTYGPINFKVLEQSMKDKTNTNTLVDCPSDKPTEDSDSDDESEEVNDDNNHDGAEDDDDASGQRASEAS